MRYYNSKSVKDVKRYIYVSNIRNSFVFLVTLVCVLYIHRFDKYYMLLIQAGLFVYYLYDTKKIMELLTRHKIIGEIYEINGEFSSEESILIGIPGEIAGEIPEEVYEEVVQEDVYAE